MAMDPIHHSAELGTPSTKRGSNDLHRSREAQGGGDEWTS
jgi:hypothetical protein